MLSFFRRRHKNLHTNQLYHDGAYQALAPDAVLRHCKGVYSQLRKEVDFPPELMGGFLDDVLLALAGYIHGLPASQYVQGSVNAGLLSVCIRTAFLAQRRAHGLVVAAHMRADARAAAERGWRYAALLAGLLFPLGILSQMGAQSPDRQWRWRPEHGPLFDSLVRSDRLAYVPYWSAQERGGCSEASVRLWIAGQIIRPELVTFITLETSQYLDDLLAVLSDRASEEDLLYSVVRKAYDDALRQELTSRGEKLSGTAIDDIPSRAAYCLQAALCDKETRLDLIRKGQPGLFVCWPAFGSEIRATAIRQDVMGLPDDDGHLLEALAAGGVIEQTKNGGWQHEMVFPARTSGLVVPCLKVAGGESISTSSEIFIEVIEPATVESASDQKIDSSVLAKEESIHTPLDHGGQGVEQQAEPKPGLSGSGGLAKVKAYPTTPVNRLVQLLSHVTGEQSEYGWWVEQGRALPWPQVSNDVDIAAQELLKLLRESGVACRSVEGPLPLIHELVREGKPTLAIVIERRFWEKQFRMVSSATEAC